jgi:hypothetical protein
MPGPFLPFCSFLFATFVVNMIDNNEEQGEITAQRHKIFNVENPLQQREVKTTGTSQQNFTILGVFYKRRGLSNDATNPRQVRPVVG